MPSRCLSPTVAGMPMTRGPPRPLRTPGSPPESVSKAFQDRLANGESNVLAMFNRCDELARFGAAILYVSDNELPEDCDRADITRRSDEYWNQRATLFTELKVWLGLGDDGHPLAPQPPFPEYAPGDRVFHQKFGYGEVTYVEGDIVDVHFVQDATENGIRWEKRLRVSAIRKA